MLHHDVQAAFYDATDSEADATVAAISTRQGCRALPECGGRDVDAMLHDDRNAAMNL